MGVTMPFTHKQILDLIKSPVNTAEIQQLRNSTIALSVTLSADMAAALSQFTQTRKLTPFLGVVADVISAKLEIDEEQLKLKTAADTSMIQALLGDDKFARVERELWYAVVRDGRAYLLTKWLDNSDESLGIVDTDAGPCYELVTCYDGNRGASSEIDPYTNRVLFTWNTWTADGSAYFDVYFPDRIEKYIRSDDTKSTSKEWMPRTDY